MVKERAKTKHGSVLLDIYFPLRSEECIEEVRSWVRGALETSVEDDLTVLGDVAPLERPGRIDVDDRIVLTDDFKELERIREEVPEIPVELVEDYRELRDYVNEYESVFIVADEFSGPNTESGSVEYLPDGLDDPVEIFPELVLDFFTDNLESIEAMIEVWRRVDSPFVDFDEGRLEKADRLLSDVSGDGVGGDEEVQRLDAALGKLVSEEGFGVLSVLISQFCPEVEQYLDECFSVFHGSMGLERRLHVEESLCRVRGDCSDLDSIF
ncbi:hypothetical protein AKJ41_02685 [candidate division MSBL1 archaeon SCGC-AAA259O05]|uniref:Uncharacterized protein n=1 Tax=candidate division MSBL1 archaeon SCGC-AAA259O05 TaxID=1698271 RepID=A0A133V3S7_9EURY|nr:hypothetical protein AKJ41_02685 [candidate division MSBL1 archaeon SCGC-AAA259O05]